MEFDKKSIILQLPYSSDQAVAYNHDSIDFAINFHVSMLYLKISIHDCIEYMDIYRCSHNLELHGKFEADEQYYMKKYINMFT